MKKFYSLALLAAAALSLNAAVFTSPGNGTTWTMTGIAALDTTGVTVSEDGKTFTVNENVIISAGDTFQMEDGITIQMAKSVEIDILGTALLSVNERTLVTSTASNVAPKYIWVKTEDATAPVEVKNLDFEYAGLKLTPAKGANIDNCTFKYQQASVANGTAALQLGGVGRNDDMPFKVTNCTFEENRRSAINTASNTSVPLTIEGNVFRFNDSQNLNYPHINVTASGMGVIIRNNTVIGDRTKNLGGGIMVADLLGAASDPQTLIENNHVRDCRYGIAVYSNQNAIIRDNTLIDNNTETNPNNGGSGINFFDQSGRMTAKVYRNLIQGSLWGVTVIGCDNINLGRTDVSENDENYCEGNNTFIENGNGEDENGNLVRYDVYNNSAKTVYAMNNYWYVAADASPENSIYHKVDDATLGEVIFTPWAGTTATGIDNVTSTKTVTAVKYVNLNGVESDVPFQGVNIVVRQYNDGTTTTAKSIF